MGKYTQLQKLKMKTLYPFRVYGDVDLNAKCNHNDSYENTWHKSGFTTKNFFTHKSDYRGSFLLFVFYFWGRQRRSWFFIILISWLVCSHLITDYNLSTVCPQLCFDSNTSSATSQNKQQVVEPHHQTKWDILVVITALSAFSAHTCTQWFLQTTNPTVIPHFDRLRLPLAIGHLHGL